jgi:hypothetical protein
MTQRHPGLRCTGCGSIMTDEQLLDLRKRENVVSCCPERKMRSETGPLQFSEDWPGIFIRGDQALGFAGTLRALIAEIESNADDLTQEGIVRWARVQELERILESCRVSRGEKEPTR